MTTTSSTNAPTLELGAAVFRRDGVDLNAALSLRSDARRLGLVGDWGFVFDALTGHARCVSGSATIAGAPFEGALASGRVGVAACHAPLPEVLTVRDYLGHAARLCHGQARRAAEEAERALTEFDWHQLGERKLGLLVPHQKRALAIIQASLGGPELVCVQSPLLGLDAQSADYVLTLLERVAARSRLIVTALLPLTPSPDRNLLDACSELVVRERAGLTSGPPDVVLEPPPRYLLTLVGRGGAEFSAIVSAAGARLSSARVFESVSRVLPRDAQLTSYLVDLPPGSTTDLLVDAALAAGMVLIDLEPEPPQAR